MLSRIEKGRIVQGGEGLEGSVGANPPRGANLAAGRIESDEARVRRGPSNVRVDAPSVAIGKIAQKPALVAVGSVPDAVELIGEYAGAADFSAEKPARRKVNVAHPFGVDANARTARKESIVGIPLPELRRHRRRLTVGGGSHEG